MSERSEVTPTRLAGTTVERLAASWYLHDGSRQLQPQTIWLLVDTLGWIGLHTPGRGGIACLLEAPGESYDMPELNARTEVELDATATAFAQHLGEPIQRVTPAWWEHPTGTGISAGFVVHYLTEAVAVVDVGDELMVDLWPSARLLERGLSNERPTDGK